MRKFVLVALLSILAGTAALQVFRERPALPPNAVVQTERREINDFLASVFEREISLSPVRQSSLGRKTDQLGQWDDLSDKFTAEKVQRTRDDYARLQAEFEYDQLTSDEQLSYDLFCI